MTTTLAMSTRREKQLQRLAQRRDQLNRERERNYDKLRETITQALDEGATLEECGSIIGGGKQRVWRLLNPDAGRGR